MLLRILGSSLLCVVVAVPASAADRIFVSFPGAAALVGDSTEPSHVDWIDAYALAGGVSNAGGAPSFEEVTFLKGPDRATPRLLELNRTSFLSQAVIEICRDSIPAQCYLRMTIENVQITSSHVSESTCLDPSACNPSLTESIELSFSKITWSYTGYDAKGNQTGTNSGCWDRSKNASCGFTNGIP